MPSHREDPTEPNPIVTEKRKSGGVTAVMEAKVLRALERKAKKEAAHEKPSLLRRVMGAAAIAMWMLFMMAEFFHLVEHAETLSHDMTKWSPLFVGLVLLAPDAFDKFTGWLGRLRGLRVSLPPREDDKPPQ